MNNPSVEQPLLVVDGLTTTFGGARGQRVEAVKNVSLELKRGEILGIVGESGSGKSTLLMSILRLLPPTAKSSATSIRFDGRELTGLSAEEMRRLRGREISLIPQRPDTALSPVSSIGKQFVRYRDPKVWANYPDPEKAMNDVLDGVGLQPVMERLSGFPHEFSGGQMQRILIAIATKSSQPKLLFADEPTSTLDVTIQAQILSLLTKLREDLGLGIVLVTHDLGVVAQTCDRVAVMYAGELIEVADVYSFFANPRHAYSQALLEAVPSRHKRGDPLPSFEDVPITMAPKPNVVAPEQAPRDEGVKVRVEDIKKHFALRRGVFRGSSDIVHAVDGVSFDIAPGEVLALVGESGCGKSTIARMLVRLSLPTAGTILLDGADVSTPSGLKHVRRSVQLVSQNPFSALNRRRTILHAITQPLEIHGLAKTRSEQVERARQLLEQVGLLDEHLGRYPSALSVGQLQRVAVVRALATEPSLLILDEPTASLDVSVKARLINLLLNLRAALDLTYLWITHEIDIAYYASDRIAVMYLGRIVEVGPTAEVFANPRHPYTQSLLASVPKADPTRRSEFRPLSGEVPSPIAPPSGCPFHTRCPFAVAPMCFEQVPQLRPIGEEHTVSCHYAEEIARNELVPKEEIHAG